VRNAAGKNARPSSMSAGAGNSEPMSLHTGQEFGGGGQRKGEAIGWSAVSLVLCDCCHKGHPLQPVENLCNLHQGSKWRKKSNWELAWQTVVKLHGSRNLHWLHLLLHFKRCFPFKDADVSTSLHVKWDIFSNMGAKWAKYGASSCD